MSNDHVGIPRFIQEGFAISGKVASYDTKLDRIRISPISKLGTDINYYDEDVEKILLANKIEGEFSKFYHDITSTIDIAFIEQTINNNTKLITQFFSFMYLRAKKALDEVNKNSLSSKVFGNLDHSELLRIQAQILVNPLEMIGKEYKILALYNFSKINLINNSIGIGAMMTKAGKVAFFMPLNTRVGIVFCDDSFSGDSQSFYIQPDCDGDTKRLNDSMVQFEIGYGNGFLFGKNKADLNDSVELFRKMNKKNSNN